MKVNQAGAYGLHALMYMVRHMTLLPATVEAIARTEGIPARHLSEVLQCLTQAGFVQVVHGREHGYVFARPPEEIIPVELLEALEGQSLCDDRAWRYCERGGMSPDGRILAPWVADPSRIEELFEEKTIVAAAWKDLERRSTAPPADADPAKLQIKSLDPEGRRDRQESRTWG